jgi:lysozyme
MTQEEAEGLLIKEVALAESYVSSLTKVSMTDDMFSALVLFTYNLGGGAFRASTLRSKLNRFDYAGASKEFPKWTYAGGVSKTGLLRRRLIEQALFNSYLQEIL